MRHRLLPALLFFPALANGAQPGEANAFEPPGQCPAFFTPPPRIVPAWLDGIAREQARSPLAPVQPQAWSDEDALVPTTAPRAVPPVADEPPQATPPLQLEADDAELASDGVSLLRGDVWLQQGEEFLSSDVLTYDNRDGAVNTLAPATFGTRRMVIDAERIAYNTSTGTGTFEDVSFFLPERYARGEAALLDRTSPTQAELAGVKYSTCPPDDEEWWLKAASMELDQETGKGVGRHVRIAFMNVPFFYIPWISFPIDDRRMTGFLFPEFGSSGRSGDWLRVPYYINIAPNMDATITPHYMSERGTRLDGQFRYLFGWGEGVLDAEYLDHDRRFDDTRHYYRLAHRSLLPADWRFAVTYQEVSDEEYVQDFSESGRATLTTHLAQTASLTRSSLEHGLAIRYLRYQTVDPTIPEARRPYEKWPEIDYYWSPLALWDRLWFELDGESVNFQRDDRIRGWRHHAAPAFSFDIGGPALRATPQLQWWHTRYDLTSTADESVEYSRSVPVASLDLRSRFARVLASGGRQTLEPQLYYLYVPYRAQDDIPLFDTRLVNDSISSLFRNNRFTGVDRVGDENRLTAGLTSRLIDASGREWFSAAVARAWHQEDRRVTLRPGQPAETASASDWYGRLRWLPSSRQSVQLDVSWDPKEDESGLASLQYQYRPGETRVLNLGYLSRRETASTPELEQAMISFATPLGGRWRIFGKAVYSFADERSHETMAGLEYETCCWTFRTLRRRYIYNREGEFDTALWFQLELKGLSSVGRRIDEFLVDDIYGYGEMP